MPVLGQFSPRVDNLELLNTLYNNIDIVFRREKDEVSIWEVQHYLLMIR